MNFTELFLQRHSSLYDFWIEGFWEMVPDELLRKRPFPNTNSLIWNLWHMARVEDVGLNRFVVDQQQVFDEGEWGKKLALPWRHIGGGMSLAEVDELGATINTAALRDYMQAIAQRTRQVVPTLSSDDLDGTLTKEHVYQVVVDEGAGHSHLEGFVANYTGWSKGKCLMNLCLTHPYQHVGEMGVIATLLGIEFD